MEEKDRRKTPIHAFGSPSMRYLNSYVGGLDERNYGAVKGKSVFTVEDVMQYFNGKVTK